MSFGTCLILNMCLSCVAGNYSKENVSLLETFAVILLTHVFVPIGSHAYTEKNVPTPLLLTLRSVYREGQVTAAVRELEVGCIQAHKKVPFILYFPTMNTVSYFTRCQS